MSERADSQRLFVTGIDTVNPLAHDINTTVKRLARRHVAIRSANGPGDVLEDYADLGYPSVIADVRDFDIGTHLRKLRFGEDEIIKVTGTTKRPNGADHLSAQLFVAASAGALRMAKVLTGKSLRVSEDQEASFGVISATGTGGILEVENGVKSKLGRIPPIDLDQFGQKLREANPDLGDRLIDGILGRAEGDQKEALAEALKKVPDLGEVIYDLITKNAPEVEAEVREHLGLPQKDKRSQDGIYLLLPGRVDEVADILFGGRAINDTQATECAAGLSAIFIASLLMRDGYAGMMLAGGTESATDKITADYFRGIKAVTRTKDPRVAGIPFGHYDPIEKEVGFVLGEGAAALNIETKEHLEERVRKGARPVVLAELLGFGASADAFHVSFPSRYGQRDAILSALAHAGLDPEAMQNIVIGGHATATGPADAHEVRSVSDVFRPDQILAMNSIKGFIGHLLGAAGAATAATNLWAARKNLLLPNRPNLRLTKGGNLVEAQMMPDRMISDLLSIPGVGTDFPDPELWRPKLITRAQTVENIGHVILMGFGFGGKNRVVIADTNMDEINSYLEDLALAA